MPRLDVLQVRVRICSTTEQLIKESQAFDGVPRPAFTLYCKDPYCMHIKDKPERAAAAIAGAVNNRSHPRSL